MDQQALRDYLAEAATRPAQFGGFDCVRFAVEALYVGWRRDFRAALGYQDRASAVARLRAAGGLEAAISAELGEPVAVHWLDPGDLALLPGSGLGLVMPRCILVKVRRTLARLPFDSAYKGWHTWDRR